MIDAMKAAEGVFGKVVEWRRDFHMNPELSNQEVRTPKKVAEVLRGLGTMEVTEVCGGHGVVGLLRGKKGGKTIAIRADMDALPVQEQNTFEYRSRTDGVMHACGHDGHTAILLGAATILSEMRSSLAGNVKFIFQPAEESLADSGAVQMVKAGVLKNPDVDAIFMLHLFPFVPSGVLQIGDGPVCAGAGKVTITVQGKGGHGSQPHKAVDALLTACQIVDALQMAVMRNVNVLDPAVLTIGQLHAGSAANVIADSAMMEGTVRTYTTQAEDAVEAAIKRIIAGAAMMSGATASLDFVRLIPAVTNNADLARMAKQACAAALPQGSAKPLAEPLMGSEDFAFYLKAGVPGAMLMLGGGIEGAEIFPNHSPKFNWDENAMKAGMAAFVSIALEYLK